MGSDMSGSMMNATLRVVTLMALAGLAGCASETQDLGPLKTRETAYGTVLADPRGMTLYTAASDRIGVSNCLKACAQAWPPLLAGADAKPKGRLTLVARDDGGRQWAWEGRPLYRWSKDLSPGDVAGHNYGDVWRVARP
jgi:predicted lipoprotein with Yx(FWY)xxD motif